MKESENSMICLVHLHEDDDSEEGIHFQEHEQVDFEVLRIFSLSLVELDDLVVKMQNLTSGISLGIWDEQGRAEEVPNMILVEKPRKKRRLILKKYIKFQYLILFLAVK